MPKFNKQRAIMLMRKFRPQSLEDIAELPIPKEDRSLMHSQFKVDFVFNSSYNNAKEYGAEYYNEPELIKQYGNPSFSRNEIDQMIQIEEMSKSLGR